MSRKVDLFVNGLRSSAASSLHVSNPKKGLPLKIRKSTDAERKKILNIHNQAFGEDKGPVIAKLVDDLLNDETAMPILFLVAVENGKLIGHILYTKAVVTQTEVPISAQILLTKRSC